MIRRPKWNLDPWKDTPGVDDGYSEFNADAVSVTKPEPPSNTRGEPTGNGLSSLFTGLISGIGDAIKGISRNASFEVIAGAVQERLGPIDTAISESGKTMIELNNKVEANTAEQKNLILQMGSLDFELTDAKQRAADALSTANTVSQTMADYETTVNQKVTNITAVADGAIRYADDLNAQRIAAENVIKATVTANTKKADEALATANAINRDLATSVESQLKVSATMKTVNDSISANVVKTQTAIDKATATAADLANADSRLTAAFQTATNKASTAIADAKTANDAAAALSVTMGTKNQTFFQSTVPTAKATGDIWIDSGNGNVVKRWSGTAWVSAQDAAIKAGADALAAYKSLNDPKVTAANNEALKATGLADTKGKVIYGTATPTGTDNDAKNLWIDLTNNANTPKRWNGSAWVAITDKAATDAAAAAAAANSLAVSKTTTFYNATAPTAGMTSGDLWIDTDDNKLYRYSGSAWVVVQDKAIQDALTKAGDAKSIADGKIKTYAQTAAPTGMTATDLGDLWIDTDDSNKLYRWSGTAWVAVRDALITDTATDLGNFKKDISVTDTRSVQLKPSDYWSKYPISPQHEFTRKNTLGIDSTITYVMLDTNIPWSDASGGPITQVAYEAASGEQSIINRWTRQSLGSGTTATWSPWVNEMTKLASRIDSQATDIKTATQKGDNALAEAQNTLTALINTPSVSNSAIPMLVGTKLPAWTYKASITTSVPKPPGTALDVWENTQTLAYTQPDFMAVTVDDSVEYDVDLWWRTDTPGTRSVIELRDTETGSLCVTGSVAKADSDIANSSASYVWWTPANLLANTWYHYKGTLRFKPGTTSVRLGNMHWVHSGGTTGGKVYIAGLKVTPHIPSQAEVDDAQNKVLTIHQALWGKQATWNQDVGQFAKAQQDINKQRADFEEEQKRLNAIQVQTDANQNTALAALNSATRLAFPGLDLTPQYAANRPYWTVKSPWNTDHLAYKQVVTLMTGQSVRYHVQPATSGVSTNTDEGAFFTPVAGIDMRVRFVAFPQAGSTSGNMSLLLYDKSNKIAITEVCMMGYRNLTTDSKWVTMTQTWRATDRINVVPTVGSAIEYEALVRVPEGVGPLRWQLNTNANTEIWVAGPHTSAYIPLQEQVDKAQNVAIQSLQDFQKFQEEFNTKQTGWNEIQTTVNGKQTAWNTAAIEATTALTNAVRALARIDIGASLVPYMDLTDAEIAAGKTQPWKPTWASGTNIYLGSDHPWVTGNPNFTQAFGVNSTTGTVICQESWTEVTPGLRYKVTYWDRSTVAGNRYYIQLKTPAGEPQDLFETGTDLSGSGSYLASNIESGTPSWVKREFYIKFKPGITKVSFWRIYFNHPNSDRKGNQYIAGMSIIPDIPTQASIDAAQTSAIKANTEAIKALGRVDIGASLITYADLTDADIAAGKVVSYIPNWTLAAPATNTTLYPTGFNASYGLNNSVYKAMKPPKHMVRVNPNQTYKLKFWEYGTGRFMIEILDKNNARCIAKTTQITGTNPDGQRTYATPYTYGLLMDYTLTGNTWTYREFEVQFKPGTEEVYFNQFYWNYADTATARTQWIAGFDLAPDIPTQADVDKSQNLAIKTNTDLIKTFGTNFTNYVAFNTEFQVSQARINRLVQSQLWVHQDMIELADIRSMKMWGFKANSYQLRIPCPYHTDQANQHYWETSWFELWRCGDTTYVACKGQWVGKLQMSTNWTGGQIDEWIVNVEADSRIFKFLGGATHINPRHFAVTISPRSLNRQASYSGGTKAWEDINGLVRNHDKTKNRARIKNAFTAKIEVENAYTSETIWVFNEEDKSIAVNGSLPIYGLEIDLKQIGANDRLVVTEIDDPKTETQGVSGTRPAGVAVDVKAMDKY